MVEEVLAEVSPDVAWWWSMSASSVSSLRRVYWHEATMLREGKEVDRHLAKANEALFSGHRAIGTYWPQTECIKSLAYLRTFCGSTLLTVLDAKTTDSLSFALCTVTCRVNFWS